MATDVPIWVPIASGLGGYALKIVADWLGDKRAANRAKSERESQRAATAEDRRADSQRQDLRDLQGVLMELVDAVNAYHLEGQFAAEYEARKTMSDRVDEVAARLDTIRVRIQDDLVRTLAEKFEAEATRMPDAKDHRKAIRQMYRNLHDCNERIGVLLRTVY